MAARTAEGLYILYFENPRAETEWAAPGLPDDAFLRKSDGRIVPMTKEEIRVITLSRLRLTPKAVLYDIGAGTGSVSIEAARLCPDAEVYAVEREPDAAALIRENTERFCLSNVHVVRGHAPEGLAGLPAPTHVFVGGSGGQMEEILRAVLAMNPRVRIVVNCIAPETLADTLSALRGMRVTKPEIRQIFAARAREAGEDLHLMRALNPVYVIDCEGKPK